MNAPFGLGTGLVRPLRRGESLKTDVPRPSQRARPDGLKGGRPENGRAWREPGRWGSGMMGTIFQ